MVFRKATHCTAIMFCKVLKIRHKSALIRRMIQVALAPMANTDCFAAVADARERFLELVAVVVLALLKNYNFIFKIAATQINMAYTVNVACAGLLIDDRSLVDRRIGIDTKLFKRIIKRRTRIVVSSSGQFVTICS